MDNNATINQQTQLLALFWLITSLVVLHPSLDSQNAKTEKLQEVASGSVPSLSINSFWLNYFGLASQWKVF